MLSKALAKKLLQLCEGERISASRLRSPLIQELIDEGIVVDLRAGRSKSVLAIPETAKLHVFLLNKFSISDLQKYAAYLEVPSPSRAESVHASSNSKVREVRTFKGFLLNSFQPITAHLNGQSLAIAPTPGTYVFIEDFERFVPDVSVTIVGIENPENFSQIHRQKHLFEGINPLFISRYPQNQNKDVLNWLGTIPNPYLHFGDFDFAGIGIYLHEYKRFLHDRATYFVPENLETMISTYGNRGLYDHQKVNFDDDAISEPGILKVLFLLHQYKKGLEQEVYISPIIQED